MTTTFGTGHGGSRVGSPIFSILVRLLQRNWEWGALTMVLPDGTQHRIEGRLPGHSAVLRIGNYRFASRVLRSGDIGFAEGYMAGEWDSPDLAVLLETLANNHDHIRRLFDGGPVMRAVNRIGHKLNRNSRTGSRRNIHAHYDLGNSFYEKWLDAGMTYSSARFGNADISLEDAQTAKYASLVRLMDLQPGHTMLEIGCGWGGFAQYAAREIGARVTGVTISREQYDFARQGVFEAGLAEKVDIRFCDYRDVEGRFDRVASIEMFEAVGQEYWGTYFNRISDLLVTDGKAGLQIITIRDDLFAKYATRTDFIQKYIFPGGSLPSEERLVPIITAARLQWQAAERFGRDYAETLKMWAQRFEAAWPLISENHVRFDERFRRLWHFYLAYCEAGFRAGRTDVIQVALQKA